MWLAFSVGTFHWSIYQFIHKNIKSQEKENISFYSNVSTWHLVHFQFFFPTTNCFEVHNFQECFINLSSPWKIPNYFLLKLFDDNRSQNCVVNYYGPCNTACNVSYGHIVHDKVLDLVKPHKERSSENVYCIGILS